MYDGVMAATPTVTMTEFNRYPSRVARMARGGSVVVTDRGVPSLEIIDRSGASRSGRYQELLAQGLIEPASRGSAGHISTGVLPPDLAWSLVHEFLDDRASRGR